MFAGKVLLVVSLSSLLSFSFAPSKDTEVLSSQRFSVCYCVRTVLVLSSQRLSVH